MKIFVKYILIGGIVLVSGVILFGVFWPGREVGFFNEENINKEEAVKGISVMPSVVGVQDGPIFVTKVISGDTFETRYGTISLIGIESSKVGESLELVECMGMEAKNKLRDLIEGKMVRLEKDVGEKNVRGNYAMYVYLDDGTFINDILVREGFVAAVSRQPNQKYQNQFAASEQSAIENRWGLWSDLCK